MDKLFKHTLIAIPTRGRVSKQATLERLHPSLCKEVVLFCHPGEGKAMQKSKYGAMVKNVTEYGEGCTHIGEIRDYIIEVASLMNKRNVIFMDDNLTFSKKLKVYPSPRVMNKDNFKEDEIYKMQRQMLAFLTETLTLPEVGITGVSFRPFNRDDEELQVNARFFAIWGLDIAKYRFCKEKLSDWPLKEDFALGIGMIQAGYNILIDKRYSFDKTAGANSKGGCSTYRNVERQNKISLELVKKYPGFVKLKTRKAGSWGGEFEGQESYDVVINWNKISAL